MEAVILAGGFGTRLQSVVRNLPKPMAPVAGRPFLELLLENLRRQGFAQAVLSIGYMAEQIVSYFGDEYRGMKLLYEVETVPLGTGGALRRALTRCETDHAFVLNGDTFMEFQAAAIEMHWLNHHDPLIVACEVSDASRYGRLNTNEELVLGFSEKGTSGPGLINAGCYLFPTSIFLGFEKPDPFSLETDFLATDVALRRYRLYVSQGRFIDIGVPEDYARAQIELAHLPR